MLGEKGERTLEFIFAYVDGGRRVSYVGGEVVDHCRLVEELRGGLGSGKGKGEGFRSTYNTILRKEVGEGVRIAWEGLKASLGTAQYKFLGFPLVCIGVGSSTHDIRMCDEAEIESLYCGQVSIQAFGLCHNLFMYTGKMFRVSMQLN